LGFLTCERRQQAIEDASGDHCQLIVIANALSGRRGHARYLVLRKVDWPGIDCTLI